MDLSGQNNVIDFINKQEDTPYILQPEYGKWMIEVVPKSPFKLCEGFKVERSIGNLYKFVAERIGKDALFSTSAFPSMGVKDFYLESEKNYFDEEAIINVSENPFSKSSFFKDVCINSHPRFG